MDPQNMISVPSHIVSTLDELLTLNNEEFVERAYHAILGRAPDSEGLVYYRARLRADISKVEILAQLRNSKEGKARPLNISGLNEAIRRHRQLKTPLLGPLLRLAGIKQLAIATGSQKLHASEAPNWLEFLERLGLKEDDLPAQLSLDCIKKLNPNEYFSDVHVAVGRVLNKSPAQKIFFYESAGLNANLYVKLAMRYESLGNKIFAIELYKLSCLFRNTPVAHEHLGNLAMDSGRYHEAISHYSIALKVGSKSIWVYLNLAHAHAAVSRQDLSVCTIADGLKAFPRAQKLFSALDDYVDKYWVMEEQKMTALAASQDRSKLIDEYEKVTGFINDQYFNVFRGNSQKSINVELNSKRILVVGLSQHVLPQCFRYRMEQKIEQLRFAGYEAKYVLWDAYEAALNLINFHDLIIFYRVPAFPGILKLIAYARSLGKITFYEVDDLVFETISIPSIETYGGQISIDAYTNLTKDIGYHRSAVSKCDYAIASTLPLLERLAPLTLSGIGFLHRNGLDKYNSYSQSNEVSKGYLNLFYGSATLAHNSDFIEEALPAIGKILAEHANVKLTVVGHLELPGSFLYRFGTQVVLVPLVRDIEAYWTYLAASDINLAVLHDDVLAGCKSELKWFEAATFSIPSVVSKTRNYIDVIVHEKDGFIVSGELQWYAALKMLVENSELRKTIGNSARSRVLRDYSIAALSKNIDQIMQGAIEIHRKKAQNVQRENMLKTNHENV